LAPGALGRCCALGDSGVCNNPGVTGAASRLGTGDGTEGPRALAGWDAGVGQCSIARKLPPSREPNALATNLTRSWDPPSVDPPPLELSPNSTRS
jgi:hypothetical protein